MKAPLSWIRQFVDVQASPQEIAEKLSLAGLEIEGISSPAILLEPVLTATVLSCEKHPNADRLSVCEVRAGDVQVRLVCGAKNVRADARVALALPGVTLPNGMTLAPTTIRGVPSSGMLCSEKELGLKEESEGILILPEHTPEGISLVQSDFIQNTYPHVLETVFEVNVTPNRGDCLSIRGIAREVAAIFDLPFHEHLRPGLGCEPERLDAKLQSIHRNQSQVQVHIANPELCPRYTGRVLRGIQVKPTPLPLQKLLEACGIRPINNIVDATNYIMLETGQPLHAFDLSKIQGGIHIRKASPGERLTTLDGQERNLSSEDLIIADDQKPLALAGVMGGADSGVNESTTSLFLESAYFDPSSVRRSSKRLGLMSDSSHRFERGIDPQGSEEALEYLTRLILYWSDASEIENVVHAGPGVSPLLPVKLRLEKAESILGIPIQEEQVLKRFKALGIQTQLNSERTLEVESPSYRHDLVREIDFIEEIARLEGDDKITAEHPSIPINYLSRKIDTLFDKLQSLRQFLNASGLNEVIHYSFTSESILQEFGEIASPQQFLINPISEELKVMRTALIPQMVYTLQKNLYHGNSNLKFFELRPVYLSQNGPKPFREEWHLSLALTGRKQALHFSEKPKEVSFYDLKGVLESLVSDFSEEKIVFKPSEKTFLHPKRQVEISLSGGSPIGYLGEIHPLFQEKLGLNENIVLAEITLEQLLLERKNIKRFRAIPEFPRMERDSNLIVSETVSNAQVLEQISQHRGPWLQEVSLLDVYRGNPIPKDKKALTYRFIYGSSERTLTDNEVNQAQEKLIEALNQQLSISLREA